MKKGHAISAAGYRILLLIGAKEESGLSFNELRGRPYDQNPKTIAIQLRKLHSWQLLSRRPVLVRGGKQHRYSLTPLGEQYLQRPILLNDLDRSLFQALTRLLRSDSKIENKLFANDLTEDDSLSYRVELSCRLKWMNRILKFTFGWERSQDQPIYSRNVKVSTVQ